MNGDIIDDILVAILIGISLFIDFAFFFSSGH